MMDSQLLLIISLILLANHFINNVCQINKSSQSIIQSRFDNFRCKPIIACGKISDEER
jgi:hypothetical protein